MLCKKLSIADMPDLVCENIFRQLDFRSLSTIPHLCKRFQNVFSALQLEIHLESITITIGSYCINIYMDPYNDWTMDIEYHQKDNGCLVRSGNSEKFLEDENSTRLFCDDFGRNVRNQKKPLKMLRLNLENEFENENDNAKLLGSLQSTLISRKPLLKVDELSISSTSISSILPCIDSKSLKKLAIEGSSDQIQDEITNIDEIVQLEQWANLEELVARDFFLRIPVKFLRHFSKIDVSLKSISAMDLCDLKNAILKSPSFVRFNIHYKYFKEEPSLYDILGPTCDNYNEMWIFEIPKTDKSILLVHYASRTFRFSKILSSSVEICQNKY